MLRDLKTKQNKQKNNLQSPKALLAGNLFQCHSFPVQCCLLFCLHQRVEDLPAVAMVAMESEAVGTKSVSNFSRTGSGSLEEVFRPHQVTTDPIPREFQDGFRTRPQRTNDGRASFQSRPRNMQPLSLAALYLGLCEGDSHLPPGWPVGGLEPEPSSWTPYPTFLTLPSWGLLLPITSHNHIHRLCSRDLST